MKTECGESVYALVYKQGEEVGELTNEGIVSDFEESNVFEVVRV